MLLKPRQSELRTDAHRAVPGGISVKLCWRASRTSQRNANAQWWTGGPQDPGACTHGPLALSVSGTELRRSDRRGGRRRVAQDIRSSFCLSFGLVFGISSIRSGRVLHRLGNPTRELYVGSYRHFSNFHIFSKRGLRSSVAVIQTVYYRTHTSRCYQYHAPPLRLVLLVSQ